MTPDQLARVLSAGEQHVHDPYTRSAINAMIGECHRIEDEQAVRLIEAPANATPAQMEALAQTARQLDNAHLPYDYQADVDELIGKRQQADFITPQGGDYAVARADRSVHVAFVDVAAAENFEQWMLSRDWQEFLRWQRASRDTAPQPMLDEVDTAAQRARERAVTPPMGTTMNLRGFTAAEPITGGQVLALDYMGRVAPCRPEDVDSIVGTAAMDANAGEQVEVAMPQHLWEVYRTGKLDRPGEVPYKGMMVPTDLKQPAMDAGHPAEVYARGLPDEPMEPAQIKADHRDDAHTPADHHQFVEHPTDSYFCGRCGNSHFHEIHDVLELS